MNPNQLLINRLVPRLRAQGQRSGSENFCKYRSFGGLRCLYGHGISDEHYHSDLEGLGAYQEDIAEVVIASNPDLGLTTDNWDMDFHSDLQSAHDDSGPNLEGFEARLVEVCNRHGYEVPA